MPYSPSARVKRIVVSIVLVRVGGSLVIPAATHAQDSDFEAALTEARDVAQAVIDVANIASEEGESTMTTEQQLMGPLAENVPLIAAELAAYAGLLESLDAPTELEGDIAAQVAVLREVADTLDAVAASAAVGDDRAVTAGYEAVADVLARLAADLSPEYFDLAFVSPIRNRFDSFRGLTEEDLAYLDGTRDARMEFGRRNADAFRAIRGTYPSPEAMMRALYEAGAGEAVPAVEAKVLALSPTERFADEHVWWLALLTEQARLDRLIGEAARDGDPIEFMVINNRLGLAATRAGDAARVYPELDPAFGSAMNPGSSISKSLDPAAPIGRDAYGTALFEALRVYAFSDPSGNAAATFGFPGVTVEMQMAAVAEMAEEFEGAWAAFEDAIRTLEPSQPYAADHERILAYLDAHGVQFRDLLAASTNGDGGAVRVALDGMRESYCSASAEFSDAITPATAVYFDATSDICRG